MTPSRRAPPRNGGGIARRGFICVRFRRRRRSSGDRRRRVRAHASSTKGERNADTRALVATSVAAPRLVAVDEKRRAARTRKLKNFVSIPPRFNDLLRSIAGARASPQTDDVRPRPAPTPTVGGRKPLMVFFVRIDIDMKKLTIRTRRHAFIA